MLVVVDLKDFVMEVKAPKIAFLQGAAMDPPLPFGDDAAVSLATLMSIGWHEAGGHMRGGVEVLLAKTLKPFLPEMQDVGVYILRFDRRSNGRKFKLMGQGHKDFEKTALEMNRRHHRTVVPI